MIQTIFAILLIVLGSAFRVLPHPANFAPVAALAIFSGTFLPKRLSFIVPITTMLISDYFLGFYEWKIMLSVYISFVLCVLLGFWLKKRIKISNAIITSLSASVLFFLITNFAVWAFTNWYPHDLSGLFQCFTMAIPFFRNTLLGDLFHVMAIFGVYETSLLIIKIWTKNRLQKNILR